MDLTTPVLAKWKEKWPEYVLKGLAALFAIFVSIIWLAIPSATWDRISAFMPSRVLWAMLGMCAVTICLLSAYISHLRRASNKLDAEIETLKSVPKSKRPKFGVVWDESLEPHCPVHTDIPLNNWLHVGHQVGYMCPGGHLIPLRDDEGQLITPKEARAKLSDISNGPSNNSLQVSAG